MMKKYTKYMFLGLSFSFFSHIKAGFNDLIISEVCIFNDSVIHDEAGNYSDWIEIYNTGSTNINLYGLYLSDDPKNLLKHKIVTSDLIVEPDSFLLLWADNYTDLGSNHLGFKLSNEESLLLYHNTTGIIDSLSFNYYAVDISIGRTEMQNTGDWKYFTEPTPGSFNNTYSYIDFAGEPKFDTISGFYSGSFSINITAVTGDTIYYATGGHYPHPDSINTLIYDGTPVEINQTTVLRAQCYKNGYLPSPVHSDIFFIDESYGLPVLSTIMDPGDLFGTFGIYKAYAMEGKAWERFAHHRYFKDSKLTYECNSGIRIQGGNSVGMPKKSFRYHFRGQYGYPDFDYPIFSKTNISSFNAIVLRSGYDDDLTTSTGILLRDPLSADLWRMTGNLSSSSEWAVLFLNDQYWGIYNVRESVDEDFIIDHLDTENFDMIRYQKAGPELKFGTMDEWNKLKNFFNTADFTLDATYDSACSFIDMKSFIDLLAFVHCAQFRSWTWGSSAYKKRDGVDKWKWTIWDTDRAYSVLTWNGFTEYAYLANEKWANFMPQKLLKNNRFKNDLINRVSDFLNAYFLPERTVFMLDSLKTIIAPEVDNEKSRWSTSSDWEAKINSVKNFLNSRPETVRNQIKSYFAIANSYNLELNIEGQGKILLNSLSLNSFPWTGIYFESVPVSITAIPEKGYKFEGWSNGIEIENISALYLQSDSALTAFFTIDTLQTNDIVINEIMYNTHPGLPSQEWIEIFNYGEQQDISGWWISDNNPDHKFFFPNSTIIDKNQYMIIAQDLNAYYQVNSDTVNCIGSYGLGINAFSLSNNNDCVKLYKKDGVLVDSVCYTDAYPWPVEADGNGPSLQLLDYVKDNSIATNWGVSTQPYFTPGYKNFFYTYIDLSNNLKAQFTIYPTAVKNKLTIVTENNSVDNYMIKVYSFSGQHLLDKYVNKSENKIELDLSHFKPGMFIIEIKTDNYVFSEKFIKL